MWRAHPRVKVAASYLGFGEVIAYPTEAVWGLGCDYRNDHAIKEILTLKHRASKKGLILVAAGIEQFDFLLADLTAQLHAKLATSWPGHNTWLVPHHNRVSALIAGEHSTVAVRVSAHPVVKALCELHGGPIVSTSANPQGLPPALDAVKVRQYFGQQVYLVPGRVGANRSPSQIRDLISDKMIRA